MSNIVTWEKGWLADATTSILIDDVYVTNIAGRVSYDTDEEDGDLDFPRAGPKRSARTRQESRRSLWAGTFACERSGGWLVEVAS